MWLRKDTRPGPVLPAGGAAGVWLSGTDGTDDRPVPASSLAPPNFVLLECVAAIHVPLPLQVSPVTTVCHFLNLSAPAFLCSSYLFCHLSFIFCFLALSQSLGSASVLLSREELLPRDLSYCQVVGSSNFGVPIFIAASCAKKERKKSLFTTKKKVFVFLFLGLAKLEVPKSKF